MLTTLSRAPQAPKAVPRPRSRTPAVPAKDALHAVAPSACACSGSCPRCRAQALPLSRPGDAGEREADRVAQRIARGERLTEAISPAPATPARTAADAGAAYAGAEVSQAIEASRGKGEALDDATRMAMGRQFGTDFGKVRVHTDASAARLSEQLHARAFTVGNDIYFRHRRYQPDAPLGQRLLAHELVHVVQQSGGRESVQRDIDDAMEEAPAGPGPGLEEDGGAEPIEQKGGCKANDSRISRLIHNFTNIDFTVPHGCTASVTFRALWVPIVDGECCTGADTYTVIRNGGRPRSLPVGAHICEGAHTPAVGRIDMGAGRQLLRINVDRSACDGISMDLTLDIRTR
jgi:hypothetical protein